MNNTQLHTQQFQPQEHRLLGSNFVCNKGEDDLI